MFPRPLHKEAEDSLSRNQLSARARVCVCVPCHRRSGVKVFASGRKSPPSSRGAASAPRSAGCPCTCCRPISGRHRLRHRLRLWLRPRLRPRCRSISEVTPEVKERWDETEGFHACIEDYPMSYFLIKTYCDNSTSKMQRLLLRLDRGSMNRMMVVAPNHTALTIAARLGLSNNGY